MRNDIQQAIAMLEQLITELKAAEDDEAMIAVSLQTGSEILQSYPHLGHLKPAVTLVRDENHWSITAIILRKS